jgi:hypothetical protein
MRREEWKMESEQPDSLRDNLVESKQPASQHETLVENGKFRRNFARGSTTRNFPL